MVSVSDTPLGFRHGPKCVVDDTTCVLLLGSGGPYTARYDLDLLREITLDRRAGATIVLQANGVRKVRADKAERLAHPFTLEALADIGSTERTEMVWVGAGDEKDGRAETEDFWLSLPYLVFCQMLAFFKSRELSVETDNPCPSGRSEPGGPGRDHPPLSGLKPNHHRMVCGIDIGGTKIQLAAYDRTMNRRVYSCRETTARPQLRSVPADTERDGPLGR